MKIRSGPYLDLPADDAFRSLHGKVRPLSGLLHDLGLIAQKELVVAVPFISAKILNEWLSAWTKQNTELGVRIIHRQVPDTALQGELLRKVMNRWQETGNVAFFTYPGRRPNSWELLPQPTFHVKLIDPGTGHLLFLSSNFNEHARRRNIEAGYVFDEEHGLDFRKLLTRLKDAAVPDPMAAP